jgi:uncharacterized membrane protein
MRPSDMHYFPLTWPFLLILVLGVIFLVALIELRILRRAYEKLGVNPRYVYGLLLLSLLGSYINIPVAALPPEEVVSNRVVSYYGVQYIVPTVEEWPRTIVAVNVGGAVIPTLLSLYLLIQNRLYLRGLAGVAIVALVVHWLARPITGVGISIPIFVPPLVAAGAALLLSWRNAAPLAYIAGSLGTLIGADLLNLDKVRGLHAPVASIGGAGTFDGIFVTGILAVLLVPATGPPRPDQGLRDKPTDDLGPRGFRNDSTDPALPGGV